MNEISDIRMVSQQLVNPRFDEPKDLISWMGAVQAQEYTMVKWAIGLRLKNGTIQQVEDAISRGDILRTHILRPTWHFVAAEDLRWMLQLSAKRIKSGMASWGKDLGISEELFTKTNDLIIKILEGNKSLTKEEIGNKLAKEGISIDNRLITHFLSRAEVEGIICSGTVRGRFHTYALIDERVPPTPILHKEEALAKLALQYFQSHSPATLEDFIWWSGLSVTEAKHAIYLIENKLIAEKFAADNLYIHKSYSNIDIPQDIVHLMPPFDEYLISYKSRTHCLPLHHYPKAFTNYGIFYPIILHNGKIVANWKKKAVKGEIQIEATPFEKSISIPKRLLKKAENNYKSFLQTIVQK